MEEGKENLGKCKSWEEETYWKHFHTLHFFQILSTSFHHHLTLPTKFAAYEKAKLPEKAILKGPNGIIWHVKLTNNDNNDVILTGDGWKDFVKAYSLQKKDLLIFKYDRTNRSFEVLILDQTSLCEREASYFARKCEQPQSDSGCDVHPKSKAKEYVICSSDSTADTDLDDECESCEKDKSAMKQKNSLKVNGTSTRNRVSTRLGASSRDIEVPSNYLGKRKSFTDKPSLEQNDSIKGNVNASEKARSLDRNKGKEVSSKKQNNRKSPAAALYKSNRRPVTEAEKTKAFEMACRTATADSFIVTMRPSHVYKRFSLIIPRQWQPTCFSRSKLQEVILRIKDKTWVTTYCASNNHGHGGIEGGWKKFALDNSLEEFDVCLFVPGGQENKCFVLHVSIFRVVPEITPPSPV